MKAKDNEIEAAQRTLSREKDTHLDRMKAKDEDVENAKNAELAARQELFQERQLLGAKVMRVVIMCNTVVFIFHCRKGRSSKHWGRSRNWKAV